MKIAGDENVDLRPVPGFPAYAVSRDGRIWSRYKRGPGGLGDVWRPMTPNPDKDGYLKIILMRDGVKHYFRVHHLVLLAFVGPCPPGLEGRHKNGIKTANNADNLLWSTHKENIADKTVHGTLLVGSRNSNATGDERRVRHAKRLIAAGRTFSEVCRLSNLPRSVVSYIKYKKGWAHVQV